MTNAARTIIGILEEAKNLTYINTEEARKRINNVIAKLTFDNVVI